MGVSKRWIDLALVGCLLGSGLGFGTGCAKGSASGRDLSVDLRTDLIAGVEFTAVEVTVDGMDAQLEAADPGADYVGGVRVGEFDDVPRGGVGVTVELSNPGGIVIARRVAVQLENDTAITVVITRDCRGVECPGDGTASNTACLGGECVDPSCTPETPELCPMDDCAVPADCPDPVQSCQQASCVFGRCLYADRGTCGAGRYCDERAGCTDIGTDAGVFDAGPRDAGTDAGPCGDVVCEGFSICDPFIEGCVSFRSCIGPDECDSGDICRNSYCVPSDYDVDGDGVPASDDCDERDATISPEAPELCNSRDDDCDTMSDEGNPGVLCAAEGGECMDGTCGCPPDRFDVDGVPETGCECMGAPLVSEGTTCAEAIDLGSVSDVGQMVMAMGNVLPATREVWYRVLAVDAPDTSCDEFHARAQLLTNPDDRFEITVFRGGCGSAACEDAGYTDFSWATDFRLNVMGRDTGQCPCLAGGRPADGVATCSDDSTALLIRVRRRDAAAPPSCDGYTLELSNGVYDT